MSYLLQRDTYAALLRNVRRVHNRFAQHGGSSHVSAVTVASLELWLTSWRTPARYLQVYRVLWQSIKVVSVDDDVAHRAAGIGNRLRTQGQKLSVPDLLIVGTALHHGLTLVTHATPVYVNVAGLTVVDWTVP